MRKPKQPNNFNFWLFVLNNPEETNLFQSKGNNRQKKEIGQAIQYKKWIEIQDKKKT